MTVTLSQHAAQRCAEFGIGLDVVDAIATRPDATWTDLAGERVCQADAYPDWTVVVGATDVVVTVLRRTTDRWEHSTAPPPNPPPSDPVVEHHPAQPAGPIWRRRSVPSKRIPAAPTTVVAVDPVALRAAQNLAGGDIRRLVLNRDGSITVLNRPRGTR